MYNEEKKRVQVQMIALDKMLDVDVVMPTEKEVSQGDSKIMYWGVDNTFPEYLNRLKEGSTTLSTIIAGCVDYATGNEVTIDRQIGSFIRNVVNRKGEDIRELARFAFEDYFTYGGFALQVIRDFNGEVADIYNVDLRDLRSNPDGDVFYYSEEWGRKYSRKDKVIVYPAFMPEGKTASSILYVRNSHRGVYPTAFAGAVDTLKACETEMAISDYHINSISNGFMGSAIIKFNNGQPDAEQKEEIERDINEKFAGNRNGGRMLVTFADDKDHNAEVQLLDIQDYGDKFTTLQKTVRQTIFTAFRGNPNLFGIPTDSLGFSAEEYESAFRLFNRTMIAPAQKMFTDAFTKIFKQENVVSITPFSI